ncbi:hypothetical protein PVL29_004085 [Vitis rotundifolia]|uniref:Protein KAKU4 n=1 Tax=Vitis rotundifolia TaxID=103349 RepID=A0AA39E0H3_VITRO|nr:hypothetical protein PVL29_004085 [Vitis rotundifolia]
MATIFRARRTVEPRSGGKVVRGRRNLAARTPYYRPTLEPPVPENPSWLFSTTRMIASGAGKLISSVFGSDSSSSSSSSSSASSGGESSAEDNVDEDNNDMDTSSHRADKLTKTEAATEIIKSFRKEPQPSTGKSETKCLIEQLLMQETFSREECDRLTEIIRSRAISCPTAEDGLYGRLSEHPDRIVDSDAPMPDLRTAVMEAKKWLEEKKLESSSKSGVHHETSTLNSVMLPHVNEGEAGSPVDMAKSYMRTRPPWASPSMSNELKTPSPTGMHLFKEETPYSLGRNSLSSSKLKRDAFASGSWNIQEEIRRVRAKATEDMLGSSPSMKIDLSEFGHKASQNSLVADRTGVGLRDKMHYSSSLTALKSINASSNLASGPATCLGLAVSDTTQDGFRNGALSLNPTISVSEQNQEKEGEVGAASNSHHPVTVEVASELHNVMLNCGVELPAPGGVDTVLQNVDGEDCSKDSHGLDQQLNSVIDSNVQAARVNDGNCLTSKEGAGSDGNSTANGFASGPSLHVPSDTEQNPRPHDDELNPMDEIHDKAADAHGGEVACELLSEASMEVPIVNETEGSENSFSMHHEELADDPRKPNSKRSLAGKGNVAGKQQVKKLTRYNRRGRGRGT